MAAIFFIDAEPFEQIDNTPSIEGLMCVKLGQAVSEKKKFKDYKILYMYIAQEQEQGTQSWPWCKKVKGHPRVIIWTNLDGLEFLTRFSHEALLVLEKKIFKCYIQYMGMLAILFNDAELFEQIENKHSTETWMALISWCYITRFSLEAFLVLEKKIFKFFFYHIQVYGHGGHLL